MDHMPSELILNGTSAQLGYTIQCHSRWSTLENTVKHDILAAS